MRDGWLEILAVEAGRPVQADWVTRNFRVDMLAEDRDKPWGEELKVVAAMRPILDHLYPHGRWRITLRWPGMQME